MEFDQYDVARISLIFEYIFNLLRMNVILSHINFFTINII